MPRQLASRLIRISAPLLLGALLLAPAQPAETAPARPPRADSAPMARPPVATPTPVSDPTAALSACAEDIFGLDLTYTRSGGLTAQVARSLSIPTQSKGVITAAINAEATAVYGQTTNAGLQVLIYGSGTGSAGDVEATVSSGSLCYLQFTTSQPAPASGDAALNLLKTTFPGVPQRVPYIAKSVPSGYIFFLATTRPAQATGGQTSQALMLSAISTSTGTLVLGALSGTGTYAASVPAR